MNYGKITTVYATKIANIGLFSIPSDMLHMIAQVPFLPKNNLSQKFSKQSQHHHPKDHSLESITKTWDLHLRFKT